MIQTLLDDLKETWCFGAEALADIQEKMLTLAVAACLDSKIRETCLKLAENKD